MYNFEIEKPKTVAEAVAALANEDATALAGGQTLIPTLKQRLAAPETIVLLSGIEEINFINRTGDVLSIGAGVTHADVASGATAYPALAALASEIGDPAVRNRGTLGGSVANNDPSACYPAAVLASGATVHTNARAIAADEFFQGMFTTDLEEGELLTSIDFPIPEAAAYVRFLQPASRFALVGVMVAKFADGVRVAVTGASEEGVFRWSEAEEALSGSFDAEALEGLSVPADGMIADIHGTAAYRAHLISVLTARAVAAAR